MQPPSGSRPSPRSGTPRLAPGLRVVRRGPDHLQVGLYADRRVLLPRTATVVGTLQLLLAHQELDEDPATAAVIDRLDQHGCLVRESPPAAGTVAQLVVSSVAEPEGALPGLGAQLRAAGLSTTSALEEADVVVVHCVGELDRDLLDPLVRWGTPHVVVRVVDGGVVLGPFVLPGWTACLRCLDAHLSVRDPDHVVVTTRYREAASVGRLDGVTDLPEPALVSLCTSWVVRDVVAHLGGREPATWSRTFRFGSEPARREERHWLRHPDCGCCWSALDLASGTMEA